MDEKELIIGDLVYCFGKVYSIWMINRDTDIATIEDEYTIEEQDIHDLKPIPITPDILEKNGWSLIHGFYCSPNEEGVEIRLVSQTGYVWNAYVGNNLLRSKINNVSDLQHLLFGLGLNSEMEV